jgi:hypothetical protein
MLIFQPNPGGGSRAMAAMATGRAKNEPDALEHSSRSGAFLPHDLVNEDSARHDRDCSDKAPAPGRSCNRPLRRTLRRTTRQRTSSSMDYLRTRSPAQADGLASVGEHGAYDITGTMCAARWGWRSTGEAEGRRCSCATGLSRKAPARPRLRTQAISRLVVGGRS